jgi:CBS domain-containing protein/sporulation protein YlmC with PRC-barrel domain
LVFVCLLIYSANVANFALSELLGAPVVDATGAIGGRVREVAYSPQEDPTHIACLIVRTDRGDRFLCANDIENLEGQKLRTRILASEWPELTPARAEGYLLLERDLLDQQIIDVHGRKVVRVNDVDLDPVPINHHLALKLSGVDVGARGAVRRLLKGVVPGAALQKLLGKIPPRIIPWNFVDLIESDPARRVKLRIEYRGLSRLHPADIADIVEELPPDQREAVFETIDEEVAAEALEEVDPKLQAAIVQSLDSERAADIVEEMSPDAAADLLADLPDETSENILEEMAPQEREEVEELLEYGENTAGGHMTKDFLSFSPHATVADAIDALREFDGGRETLNTLYLVDKDDHLVGAVPLSNIVLAESDTQLDDLKDELTVSCPATGDEHEAAELLDKYNLLILPVVDKNNRILGIITADDVISMLRRKH